MNLTNRKKVEWEIEIQSRRSFRIRAEYSVGDSFVILSAVDCRECVCTMYNLTISVFQNLNQLFYLLNTIKFEEFYPKFFLVIFETLKLINLSYNVLNRLIGQIELTKT